LEPLDEKGPHEDGEVRHGGAAVTEVLVGVGRVTIAQPGA
jgi:hypothetical protein